MICVHCGQPFEQNRKWHRYCSDKCRYERYADRSRPAAGAQLSAAAFDTFAGLAAELQGRHAEIIERAISVTDWPVGPGVYFLLKDDAVIYVGKTISLASRIANHCADRIRGEKDFDSFSWIQCGHDDLDQIERTFLCIYATTIAIDSYGNPLLRRRNALAGPSSGAPAP